MKLCRCGAVVKDRCERCHPQTHDKTTTQRGYDTAWRKLSERVRKEQPLCERCLTKDRVRPATECHHIIKIKDALHLRLVRSNIMSVCRDCHEELEASMGAVRKCKK